MPENLSRVEEQMEIKHDRTCIISEEKVEDRISNLPNDIIHLILSFLDMKHAIQFCTLSRKWKDIWTLNPNLNLNKRMFPYDSQFTRFVDHALSHRNNEANVSSVDLTLNRPMTTRVVKDIINYAYVHKVTKLSMIVFWASGKFPQYLFSSHTLKHLTISRINPLPNYDGTYGTCVIPGSTWDFPALETLNLTDVRLGCDSDKTLDLFSKCVNLKDLTLRNCSMVHLEIFNVSAPQLSNLTITNTSHFPKVFNVVAPQIENLQASIGTVGGSRGQHSNLLQLSTEGFSYLKEVNLSLSHHFYVEKKCYSQLLDLFKKLSRTKVLIIDLDIIEALSLYLDEVSHEPCPFDNLKCLKIGMLPLVLSIYQRDRIRKMAYQVKNYILENSPSATFIIDLPRVSYNLS